LSTDNHSGNINNVITNWSGVNRNPNGGSNNPLYQEDPRLPHINAMGGISSKICSANKGFFSALDDTLWTEDLDGAYPVKISSGNQLFEYKASAPHKTFGKGYFDYYITKDGWNTQEEPTWESLEETPFCRYLGEPNRNMQKTEKFPCNVPVKTGKHLIYAVWQRDDSPEAFYSCSDVVFNSDTVNPTQKPVETSEAPTTTTSTTSTTTIPSTTSTNSGLTTTQSNSKYSLFHENHINLGESSICVSKSSSNRLITSSCGRDSTDQQFFNHLNYQIRSVNNLCWEIDSSRGLQFINMVVCEDYKKSQMFSYDPENGSLHPTENYDYCVTKVGTMLAALPCKNLLDFDESVFGLSIE